MAVRSKPEAGVPRARKRTYSRLSAPRTLDRRGGLRAATLSAAAGVDPRRLPELAPLPTAVATQLEIRGVPTGMAYLDGRLYITAIDGDTGVLHCFRDGKPVATVEYTPDGGAQTLREIVQFNLYSDPSDPLGGEYRHIGIVFPDAISFPLGTDELTVEALDEYYGMPIPRLSHICVHLSRLFGAEGDRLYASAYNDPRNWNVDTATDAGAANAWAATVQSNTEASGDFCALTVFGGQVHAFKEGFCHVLSNTKNPFRVGDLFAAGAAAPRSVAEVGGKLFFADRSQVYRYNGDSVTPIGDPLGGADLSGAIGCAGEGMYYLYLPSVGEVLVYAVESGAWSSLGRVGDGARVLFLSRAAGGPLLFTEGGRLYTLSAGGGRAFACDLAPLLEDGEATLRIARLALTVEGEAGARITACYRDLSERECPLLDCTLSRAGLARPIGRMFTPADRGGYLSLSAEGQITVQRIELVTETQE